MSRPNISSDRTAPNAEIKTISDRDYSLPLHFRKASGYSDGLTLKLRQQASSSWEKELHETGHY